MSSMPIAESVKVQSYFPVNSGKGWHPFSPLTVLLVAIVLVSKHPTKLKAPQGIKDGRAILLQSGGKW